MKITTAGFAERRAEMVSLGAWNDRIITDYLDEIVSETPDSLAVVGYRVASDERKELTYGQLDSIVTRMAAGLAALGVGKGEVVSCQLPNWWEMIALNLACVRIGAVLNPLMPIFRERELRFMLAHAETRVLVVPQSFRNFNYAEMVANIRADLPNLKQVLVIGGQGDDSFEKVLLERAWEEDTDTAALFAERKPSADDVIQLLFTSGTTGEPKGVLHTSNTLFSNVRPYAERLHLKADDVIMMSSPMAHQTGFLYGVLMPVYLKARVVLQDIWDARAFGRIASAEKPTFTMASTPFLADLIDTAPTATGNLDSLRIFVSAGAPIPGALVERAAGVLPAKIISAWGMTENGAVTMTRPEDDASRSSTTDGVALPFMEVKVENDQHEQLGAGQEGNLLVRGASLFVGYLKRPELYSVDAEGWFATGDLATIDADGYIRITGRTKDVIIRGGENIPVVEIENLLYKHPGISAVALVGCPDQRLGERMCAYVTLHNGYTDLTLDEVAAFLSKQGVSRNYLPEYLEVLQELPRTPSGKIQKFKLRDMAQNVQIAPAKRA
ncbi:cyclohexanecarboxylate-CoA ligase [Pseudomonas saliphila]|uniref:cyclohexanecarboxylate-CoA ligase n=1 Tax=Pseudomonas saliphila TaxID=2586906 RepID=UPI00123C1590|nr:cyclohexanecarboxylate-CoA ligase [Pseudomonas saliphila]